MVAPRHKLRDYLVAVLVVVLATLARRALDPAMGDRAPLITYIVAVSISAWMGGIGPGLVTLSLGGLAGSYFFFAPRGSWVVQRSENQIALGLFALTGLIIVVLAQSQRYARGRAEASARQAVERQALLEAEVARRERIEREREGLLAEQARLRAVAEEQSATLVSLLDQAPIAIVLYDADLRHVQANSQAAAMIGLTPDQAIGRSLRDLLEGVMPEARLLEFEGLYRRTIETGEPFSAKAWDTEIRRPRGGTLSLDWSIQRVDRPEGGMLGLLGTYVDVTEEIGRDAALRQSEERFRLAADAVNGLIDDVDMTTGHVERTRGLFELLGYQPEEVPPTLDWWRGRIHPDDLEKFLLEDSRSDGPPARSGSEYRVRHLDGRYLHVIDRRMATLGPDGRVVRYVGCTQDVTEIRQAEQALVEADRRKDEFLAILAHEIRNPLASIRNALRLLKLEGDRAVPESDRGNDLEMAERQVAHLARLVDDLMDVSRITRGRIELRKEPVELADVVHRAVDAVRPSIEHRGHTLSVDLPAGPIRLEADPTRLEQVFGNLLTNAVKYTPRGGRIGVSANLEGGEVVVTVRDSGLGIGAGMLPRVFEMFVQDGNHLDHSQGGLGIGLGLSRSLVELHGGKISAWSEGPGLGSEFEVRLPTAAGRSDGSGRRGRTDPTPPGARRRVLVVDDNEAVARSLARLLERMYGQEVRVVHDGPSALELAGEFGPEVILLDIGMPEMDGYEVARRLRERPEFSGTLLVALTGWGQDADRERSRDAGIDHHLVKPVDPDELGALIASARPPGHSITLIWAGSVTRILTCGSSMIRTPVTRRVLPL